MGIDVQTFLENDGPTVPNLDERIQQRLDGEAEAIGGEFHFNETSFAEENRGRIREDTGKVWIYQRFVDALVDDDDAGVHRDEILQIDDFSLKVIGWIVLDALHRLKLLQQSQIHNLSDSGSPMDRGKEKSGRLV